MIIAQISDSHIDLDDANVTDRIRDLERCVRDINGLEAQPDVVIHTGDLAHNGTPEKYREAARILSDLCCPLYIAAGNRDDRTALCSVFPDSCAIVPGTPYIQYSVETFPVRLIAIDTLSETSNKGNFCKARADNLSQILAENKSKPTVVFMHHPPFEVHQSKHRWQFDSREAIATLERSLEGHDKIVRAFCGHSHREVEGTTVGIPASCVPSVAINLRLGEFPDSAAAAPVYQIHQFDRRSGFSTETRVAR